MAPEMVLFEKGDVMTLASDITPLAVDSQPRAIGPVDQLNQFLRGEISAAETYRMAIEKISGSTNSPVSALGLLREAQAEHGRAAQALRDRIRELGGEPEDSSGAWGVWAKFAEGVANLLGDTASLKALKEGEEHGLTDYINGVERVDLSSADLVQNQLIPSQQRHINLLDQLTSTPKA
jgi:bacterioferritin (cytochrome b1)